MALAGLILVPAAVAGKLPADGTWRYDNTSTLNSTHSAVVFQALVSFTPGRHSIRSIQGVVMRGTCTAKDGHVIRDTLVDFSVNGYTKGIIAVKSNGTFAATLRSTTDTGSHGTVTVKGAFNARELNGSVTVHNPHTAYGDCKGTGTFLRAKGVRVG